MQCLECLHSRHSGPVGQSKNNNDENKTVVQRVKAIAVAQKVIFNWTLTFSLISVFGLQPQSTLFLYRTGGKWLRITIRILGHNPGGTAVAALHHGTSSFRRSALDWLSKLKLYSYLAEIGALWLQQHSANLEVGSTEAS